MPEPEPDWDTIMEQRAEAERDWFGWDEVASAEALTWGEEEPF